MIFSGCGEVQFPESVSTATPLPITPQVLATPTPSGEEPSTTTIPQDSLSCLAVQKERDNLTEAVKISQEELRTCQAQNTSLLAAQNNAQNSMIDAEKFAPILRKYLTETPQKDYPFPICGGLGKATSLDWYPDFTSALTAKNIQFNALKRALTNDDFGGVCASTEGNIAIFLGASTAGKSEFHLLRYAIDTKVLEEAVFINGGCGTTCPTKFGKRDGAVITLEGNGKEYKYYYDSNLITE